MIFQLEIPVPPFTSKAAPLIETLTCIPGVVERMGLIIPEGACGLAGFCITYHGVQLWPATAGAWFSGNNSQREWGESFDLTNEVPIFEVHFYNTDTVYTHTITVWINIVKQGATLSDILEALKLSSAQAAALGVPISSETEET